MRLAFVEQSIQEYTKIAPHSVPAVDYQREALSFECPLQQHTVGTEWGATSETRRRDSHDSHFLQFL